MQERIIKFGIIGFGNIGSGVVKNFLKFKDLIISRAGMKLELARVADVELSDKDKFGLGDDLFTDDAYSIINDPDIPIIVELVGGTTVAKDFVLKAIEKDKMVVTANKALIAEYGPEILKVLSEHPKADLFFEASVGGGIPIIKVLREGLIANEIKKITAIINGTANFILTEMERSGMTFDEALKSAQEKGFAEPDPTFDIEGYDAGHKISILASIAFGKWVNCKNIKIEGITGITIQDIVYAGSLGYRIKLLAMARKKDDAMDVRVVPALLSLQHPLASVSGSFNAIYIHGDPVGESMLYGKGAGDDPTSSAVIADIVDAAECLYFEDPGNREIFNTINGEFIADAEASSLSRYYVRILAQDKPGVLSGVSGIFAKYDISISSVLQQEETKDNSVPVVMMTHGADEKKMAAACIEIEKLDCIQGKITVISVLAEDS